jgi:hypothetical protein
VSNQIIRWTLVILVLAEPAQATIRGSYPGVDMAFVGNHVLYGSAGTIAEHPFALRLTDPAGNPLAGLTVYFQPDYEINLNPDLAPPLSAYGNFGGNLEVAVITDQNGVARSPDFRIGQFGHSLIAGLPSTTPENVAVTQGGWGYALFHVNVPHYGPVDPQAPVGGMASTALPSDSLIGRAMLALALVFGGLVALCREPRDPRQGAVSAYPKRAT